MINALFDRKSGLDEGHINTLVIVDDVGDARRFNIPDSKKLTVDNAVLDNSSDINFSDLTVKTLSLFNTAIPQFNWENVEYIDITNVDSDNSGTILLPPWFVVKLLNFKNTKILLDHGQKIRVQKIFTERIKERLQYK